MSNRHQRHARHKTGRCGTGHAWRVLSIRRGANLQVDCGSIVEDIAVMACVRCHKVRYEPAGAACSCTTCGCICQTHGQVDDCGCGCPPADGEPLHCGCSCEHACPPEHAWLCDRCGEPVDPAAGDHHETDGFELVHASCAAGG